jgi:hypothetical protein
MEGGKITGNNANELFEFQNSDAEFKKVTITDNASGVIFVNNGNQKVTMTECTLGNNTPNTDMAEVRVKNKGTLAMIDCVLGDTTFDDKNMVEGVGSFIGDGSLTMIVAFVVLIASIASIIVNVSSKKKKAISATANGTAETEDEA